MVVVAVGVVVVVVVVVVVDITVFVAVVGERLILLLIWKAERTKLVGPKLDCCRYSVD